MKHDDHVILLLSRERERDWLRERDVKAYCNHTFFVIWFYITLMIIVASTEEGDKELSQQKREVIQAVASF